MEDQARARRSIERLRARQKRHRERGRAYRIGFATLGFAVLGSGIAMLVLPGPGLLVTAVGLAMLALEFRWAERVLERALRRIDATARNAAHSGPVTKALGAFATAFATVALVAAILLWDIPLLPF